jgi:hypothetical protein
VAETVSGLVSAIVDEASFDVTSAQALAWLNRRWRSMLGRARAYRKTITIGSTTSGTAFYAVAGVLELYELEVAGVPYGPARRPDVYSNSQSRLTWSYQGEVGLFVADASSAAVKGVTLIPTPTSTGLAITGFAATEPPDLTNDGTGDALLAAQLDGEFVEALIDGAMAIGYRREGNIGLARDNDAVFDAACGEFLRITKRRYRGPGATQIRVEGAGAA